MIELIVLTSLGIAFFAYAIVVHRDKSFFCVLTPIYFTFIPGYYLFELIHIYFFGYSAQTSTYLYCYATYGLAFLFLALAYTYFPSYSVKLPFNVRHEIKYLPYVVLAAAVFVYLPILIEYRDLILDPRAIYVRTRVGYGHMYFTSSALVFLAYILCLFKQRPFRGEKALFFTMCVLWCLSHGSKGQVVQLILIGLMFRVFVSGKAANFSTVISYAAVFAIGLGSLFYFFSDSLREGDVGLLVGVASYADYNRNAMMLIEDDNFELQYGKLTLESAIYSRVPRVLYPAKPDDWGTFALARKYYPVWFEKKTGSASFGVLGVPFADFGHFAMLYLISWAVVTGVLLKIFMVRLKKYRDPSDFIMVLFLANVVVIPTGVGYTLPEHLVLAFLLSLVLRLKLVRNRAVDMSDVPAISGSGVLVEGR